jgi:hypothetical protein
MDAVTQDNADTTEPTAPKPSEHTSAPADQVTAAEEGKASERDEKGRYRNPVQPRIDQLTRDANTARREAEYWKGRAAAIEAKANPPAPPPSKPVPDQFDTYDAYVEALTEWKADERVSKKLAERDEQQREVGDRARAAVQLGQERRGCKSQVRRLRQRAVAVRSQRRMRMSPNYCSTPSKGAELAYYLDRNPDIADKLNGMSEKQAAREIGRIEARLSAEAPAPVDESTQAATPPQARARGRQAEDLRRTRTRETCHACRSIRLTTPRKNGNG